MSEDKIKKGQGQGQGQDRDVKDFNGDKVPAKTDPKKMKKNKRFVLLKFKLSASIGGYESGAIISLKCDKKTKSPKDRYWRRRLKDAIVDNCIARC